MPSIEPWTEWNRNLRRETSFAARAYALLRGLLVRDRHPLELELDALSADYSEEGDERFSDWLQFEIISFHLSSEEPAPLEPVHPGYGLS